MLPCCSACWSKITRVISEITYAAKAYFSLGFARKLAGMDLGVDVVSLGETARGNQGRLPPRENSPARQ